MDSGINMGHMRKREWEESGRDENIMKVIGSESSVLEYSTCNDNVISCGHQCKASNNVYRAWVYQPINTYIMGNGIWLD